MNSGKTAWMIIAVLIAIFGSIAVAGFTQVQARFDSQDSEIIDLVKRMADVSEKLTEKVMYVEREVADVRVQTAEEVAQMRAELTQEIHQIQRDLSVHKAQQTE